MPYYVKRPSTIEARQVSDVNLPDILQWVKDYNVPIRETDSLYLLSDNGRYVEVSTSDWVLRTKKGFRAMTDAEFKRSYAPSLSK